MKKIIFLSAIFMCFAFSGNENTYSFQIALLKYGGGGDWYANLKTSLPNLIAFCNKNLNMNINPEQAIVDVGSPDIFNYPFVHMTGHGNWSLTPQEAQNLRNYLVGGGFLHIDDNFGLDPYVRPQLKKVFPELDLILLPFSFPIYHQKYEFPHGMPKIHEHDGGPPKGYGLIFKGRLVCFYSFDTDLGNGWESYEIYHDPPELHEKALEMGANLLEYVLMGKGDKNQ
ncbi:MAG: DUF4159 domain-containing protein [Bacteroidia bacterium]